MSLWLRGHWRLKLYQARWVGLRSKTLTDSFPCLLRSHSMPVTFPDIVLYLCSRLGGKWGALWMWE